MAHSLHKNKRSLTINSLVILFLLLISGGLFILNPSGPDYGRKTKASFIETIRPTAWNDPVGNPETANPGNAIDTDTNTFSSTPYGYCGSCQTGSLYSSAILFQSFETPSTGYTDLTLKVRISDDGPATNNSYSIEYSVNGFPGNNGDGNFVLFSTGGQTTPTTISLSLSPANLAIFNADPSSLLIRVRTSLGGGSYEPYNLFIYDIWAEGTSSDYPAITINSVTQTTGTNDVVIDYDITDPDEVSCDISVRQFNIGSGNQTLSTFAGGDGLTGLSCSPTGENHTMIWSAGTDAPGSDTGSALINLQSTNSTVNGPTTTSSSFSIDTKNPVFSGSLSPSDATSSSVVLTLSSPATDTNFQEYKIFYATNPGVSEASSSWTSTDDPSLGSIGFSSTTITGLTAGSYWFNTVAYDSFGNKTYGAETGPASIAPLPTSNPPTYIPPPLEPSEPQVLPADVIASVSGGSAEKGGVKVSVPQGATAEDIRIKIDVLSSAPKEFGEKVFVKGATISASSYPGGESVKDFGKDLSIIFQYSDSDIVGLDKSSLKVYYFNESTQSYEGLPTTIGALTNLATATVNHLSTFILWADKNVPAPPQEIDNQEPIGNGDTGNINQPTNQGGSAGGATQQVITRETVREVIKEVPTTTSPTEKIQSIYNTYNISSGIWQIASSILLALLAAILGVIAYQVYRLRRQIKEAQEEELRKTLRHELLESEDYSPTKSMGILGKIRGRNPKRSFFKTSRVPVSKNKTTNKLITKWS